ncbi:MAG: type VI secretion system contractile sheath domain-containing protein [Pyrinomonadaceae bacterium]
MPINAEDLETAVTLEGSRTGIVEEPPFHILVLGDWSGDADKRDLDDRKPIEIDRDEFDDVIRKLGVRIDLDFDDGTIIPLEFSEIDDFHPDAIFRTVQMFSDLRDLRKKLKNEDTFYSAAREVRDRFGVAELSDKSESVVEDAADVPADDLLGAILSKPSGGAPAPKPRTSSNLGNLITDLVRPHLVLVDENEQAGMLAAVDEATSGLMRTIIHHRKFQELEAAWRALYFFVRRTETSTDLKIFLLDVSKDELADNLKSVSNLDETTLYRHLVKDAYDADPWALVVAGFAYSPNVDDVASLMRISKICATSKAPFVSHMRPDVLGVHSLHENAEPRQWKIDENSEAGKLWAALCAQKDSEYLGMTIPRFLSRLPYGAETEPLETFQFEEFAAAPVHDQYAWANSAFIAAQLIAESYSSYGWDLGRAFKQDVEGLPVHVYKDGTETVFKPCGEVLLTEDACNKLMNHGLMPLISYKNTDRVKLARFHSIADTALKGMWS